MAVANLGITRSFESIIRRAVRGPCGLRPGARLLVAVSGGQDSLALLLALSSLQRGLGGLGLALTVGHIDHQLRGHETAQRERDLVEAVAARLGIRVVSAAVDTRAIVLAERCSLEDAARRGRYRALAAMAAGLGAEAVATGHTATDQAETVVMRLLQGAGMHGLAGMRYRSAWPVGDGPILIRPLLGVTRAQTAAYCQAQGVTPAEDASNTSDRHRRNRIRSSVLPLLERENPAAVAALARVADAAADAAGLIAAAAEAAWPSVVTAGDGGLSLAVDPLLTLPKAVMDEVLRRVLTEIGGASRAVQTPHIRALARLAAGAPGRGCQLPAGWRAVREAGALRLLQPGEDLPAPPSLPGEWPLARGTHQLPGWRITCVVGPCAGLVAGRFSVVLDAALLAQGAVFTGRRAGDRIEPAGMRGSRSLQDLLVDAKVPAADRAAVPVLRCGGRVAWVVGVRVAGWALATPGRPAMRVTAERMA